MQVFQRQCSPMNKPYFEIKKMKDSLICLFWLSSLLFNLISNKLFFMMVFQILNAEMQWNVIGSQKIHLRGMLNCS